MRVIRDLFQLFPVLIEWSRGVRRSKTTLALVVVTGTIAGLGNTALIAIINTALFGEATPGLMWSFIGLCALIPMSGAISNALLARLTARAGYEMRMRLCRQIISAPLRVLEEIGVHRLFAMLTDDIPTVTATISTLPPLFTQFGIVIGCLVYLGWLSPPLLLIVLAYMFVGIISYQFPLSRSVHYFRLLREEWDRLLKAMQSLTEGTKELKLHRPRRQEFIAKQLESALETMRRYVVRANTIGFAANQWGQILFLIFVGLILFAAPILLSVDRQTLTGYALTVLYMNSPLAAVLNTMPTLGRARIAFDKIKTLGLSLTEQPAEVNLSSEQATPTTAWSRLDLAGVTHMYKREGEPNNFTLGPLDLSFQAGEIVFLIGGNGSGKTTLAKLLAGLYAPESGEILLDGRSISAHNRDDYRQLFSAIFSDYYLFDSLLGIENQNLQQRVQEYLDRLQLSHKVQFKDGGLSTLDLSQGQRKRLALLTAYLEDRSLYIFDEWAADQDPTFKRVFYHQILPELKASGKTLIVISHDDRFYHLADRIIKLENGQLEYDKRYTPAEGAAIQTSAPFAVP